MAKRITFVLALPAEGAFETHRRRRRGPSRKTHASTNGMEQKGHVVTVAVTAGKDIEEAILSNLSTRIPSCLQGHAHIGVILTASGAVSRPVLVAAGAPITIPSNEESFPIFKLQGSFSVNREGSAMTTGLTILCGVSENNLFGGSIAGPLIAAGPTQVTLLVHTNEDDDAQEEGVSGQPE